MRLVSDEAWAVMNLWIEGRGEPLNGKIAIGEVMRRRLAQGWAKTLPGVILAAYAFSGWNSKDPNRVRAAVLDTMDVKVQECRAAWEASATSDLVPGAVFYYNPDIITTPPDWAKPDRLVKIIGHHHFFRA